ncbi:MAG: alpha/beta fold hydrolase [Alphaproteobacteria bacterium]|nr:alpha/beta fold hydrolase [Alphaproteobacteria bacterium]
MARHWTVVRYDMLGHGGSTNPPGQRSLRDFVEQIIRLLDYLGFPRAAIVGFSMGGMIAQAVAVNHPDRVERLGILNAVYARTPEQRAAVLERLRQVEVSGPAANVDIALKRWFTPAFAAAHPATIEAVRRQVVTNDHLGYLNAYRVFATADADLIEPLRTIRCPTLVATGELDPNSTPDMAHRMAATIPGAHAVILPGLPHMVPIEGAAAVNNLLHEFMASPTMP